MQTARLLATTAACFLFTTTADGEEPKPLGRWEAVVIPTGGGATVTIAVAANGRIYAIGGGYAVPAVATTEAYTPTTNTWAAVKSMASSREELAAVAGADGRIYAIGGQTTARVAVATLEAYTP